MSPMTRQSILAYGEPLQETHAPLPVPTGTEVLLRVGHCGVCHSDLHLHEGHFGLGNGKVLDVRDGRTLPFTLGHEIEGTVEALGPEAEAAGVEIGAERVLYPWVGCGQCPNCQHGEEHLCERPRQIGIQVDGGYATHVMVPHPRYLLDATGVPKELAGSYMCSGVTAFSALKKLADMGKRGPILIVGLGGVGMMGLAFAKAFFDQAPYVADIDPAKREAALAAGAAAAFDPSEDGVRKRFFKETGGGVFGAVDFVGAEGSLNFAQAVLRKGGKVVIVGLMGGAFSLPIPMFPLRGITIEGSYVGSREQAIEMLDLVRSGKVESIPFEVRPLSEANRSLDDLRAGRVAGRLVLAP